MNLQTIVPITDNSQIGEARRQMNRLAEAGGFNEADRGKAAIIVSELATNLARHATGGEILMQLAGSASAKWLDVLSVDRGPGMDNVQRCLADGFSTGGTPGTGLGAARRLSSEFEIYSAKAAGTVVFSRLFESAVAASAKRTFNWGVISRPMMYETECGDAWRIVDHNDRLAITIVDGLGHGPEAAKAALQATLAFDQAPQVPLTVFFNSAHARMHGTRGGAMAAAQIDTKSRQLAYLGIGNISGHLFGENGQPSRSLFSHNGIVGHQIRKLQQFDYECSASGLLIMHSDGLQGRWALEQYPGLTQSHPAVIAAVLYRDFIRGRDDVTVAVVRFCLNGVESKVG